ncbi:MAG: ATP-dependent DNA helicase [Candidatus Gastranaerophilales bacterium]|nr:ATP-dependent DNA helicase [Candidatus Gastranaerophilales bacterium]
MNNNAIEPVDFVAKIINELNDEQKDAVKKPIDYCTKIIAGAGTGKTKIISKRFLKLVYDLNCKHIAHPVEKILVITFTDKAACEMKSRILKELKENNIDYIGQELYISTFHSFCSKILKKHSLEANLSSSFKLADEKILKDIYTEIIEKIKNSEYQNIESISDIASELNLSESILAVENINELTAIGSLEAIFDDIFGIIKKIKAYGLSPYEFLKKTLSSVENFSHTVQTLPFKFETKEDYCSAWNNHLSKYQDDNFEIDEKIFDEISKSKLILDKAGQRKPINYCQADTFPENISQIDFNEKNLTRIIALIYGLYQKNLELSDMVDFDDLINKTIQILKQNSSVRDYYKNYFKHIIIDEFQDTNGSQLELIKLLLNDDNANITFVGDRKQSIYSFRYAQMENLEVLHSYVENKYGEKYDPVKLKFNYRSTPYVLNAVNFITKSQLQIDEQLSANPKKEFDDENKYVKITPLEGFDNAIAHKKAEAKYIASEIKRLQNEDMAQFKDFAVLVNSHSKADIIDKILSDYGIPSIKKVNLSFFTSAVVKNSIAILRMASNLRDEIAIIRILKIKFSDAEIYNLKKQADSKILEKLTFKELKKFNFADKINYLISNSLLNSIDISQPIFDYINKIVITMQNIQSNKKSMSLLQIYLRLINELSPHNYDGIEKYKAENDMLIFQKLISDYMQGENYLSIKNFLQHLEKLKDDKSFTLPQTSTTECNAVQIMTVHASKGLEFPYTFLTTTTNKTSQADKSTIRLDLQYGEKPGFGIIAAKYQGLKTPKALLYSTLWKTPRDKSEKLRLFYVAVSRAEKYLNILSFTPYGNKGAIKPADYIADFNPEFIKEAVDINDLKIEKQELPIISKKQKETLKPQIKNNKIPANNIYNLSFTKINTYNHCKNQYVLKYEFGYPDLNEKTQSLQIGTLVHNMIYTSYINKCSLSASEIQDYLLKSEISQQDKSTVISLYQNFTASPYSPENLSYKELYPEKNFIYTCNMNKTDEIIFEGDIDLLIKNNDSTFTIIDFKTNKDVITNLDNYYKQLYIYKKAIENLGLNVKEAKIVNIKNNGTIYELALNMETEKKLSTAFEQETKETISTKTLTHEKDKKKCIKCGYQYMCMQ